MPSTATSGSGSGSGSSTTKPLLALEGKVWSLERETELRVSCRGTRVSVVLLEGVVEVFGVEMKVRMEYTFCDTSFALFSWYGAKVRVTQINGADGKGSSGSGSGSGSSSSGGKQKKEDPSSGSGKSDRSASASTSSSSASSRGKLFVYKTADSHMMHEYVQLHGQIDQVRIAALSDVDAAGPRVIVVGPPNSGKSSLVRMLCAYAVRVSRVPLFVDLDVSAGDTSMPGSLVASPVDMRSLSVEYGVRAMYPLALYYGHSTPSANSELFKRQVSHLATNLNACLAKNKAMRNSGLLVNACGWTPTGAGSAEGRDALVHAIRALECDVVIVMKSQRMFVDMQSEFEDQLTVMKVQQSGGVEELGNEAQFRRERRLANIRRYFYGDPHRKKWQLAPSLTSVSFDDIRIVRIGDNRDDKTTQAMTPLGQEHLMRFDPFRVHEVDPSDKGSGILHAILAVSHATKPEDVVGTNVAGYVWVKGVDVAKRLVEVLQPNHTDFLSGKILVLGAFTFIDRGN